MSSWLTDGLLIIAAVPQWILLSVAMFGLIVAVASDQVQIIAKYHGAISRRVARGYNRAMKIMVLNRIGAVIYFLFCGFIIDNGVSASLFVGSICITFCFLALCDGLVAYRYTIIFRLNAHSDRKNPEESSQVGYMVGSVVATILNLLGITVPLVMGAKFPEYRLTLSNTGFLFNTLYTFINVFFIESFLAAQIDGGVSEVGRFVRAVLWWRVVSCLFAAATLASLGVWE